MDKENIGAKEFAVAMHDMHNYQIEIGNLDSCIDKTRTVLQQE